MAILTFIVNLLFKFLKTEVVRDFIIKKLKEYTKDTENQLDDQLVLLVEKAWNNEKDLDVLENIYNSWVEKDTTDDNSDAKETIDG